MEEEITKEVLKYNQIIRMLKEFDYNKNTKDDLIYFLTFCLNELKKNNELC